MRIKQLTNMMYKYKNKTKEKAEQLFKYLEQKLLDFIDSIKPVMLMVGVKPVKISIYTALIVFSLVVIDAMAIFIPSILSSLAYLLLFEPIASSIIKKVTESLLKTEFDRTKDQADSWGKSDKKRNGFMNKCYAWLTKNIFKPLAKNVSFKKMLALSAASDIVCSVAIAHCYSFPYASTILLSIAATSACIGLSANFIGYFAYYQESHQSQEESLNKYYEKLIKFRNNDDNCLTNNLNLIKTELGNDFETFRTISKRTLDKIMNLSNQKNSSARSAYLYLRAFQDQINIFNNNQNFSNNPIINLIKDSIINVFVKPETNDVLLSDEEAEYLNDLIVLFTALSQKENESYMNGLFGKNASVKEAVPLNYKFNELSQRKLQPEHVELQKGMQHVSGKFSLVANNLLLLKNEPENNFTSKNDSKKGSWCSIL